MLVLLLLIIGFYLGTKEKESKKDVFLIPIVEKEKENDNLKIPNKIKDKHRPDLPIQSKIESNKNTEKAKEKPLKVKPWNWERFCTKHHNVGDQNFCYQQYIQKKCADKSAYKKSYLDFVKESKDTSITCKLLKDISSITDDEDLVRFNKDNHDEIFFK